MYRRIQVRNVGVRQRCVSFTVYLDGKLLHLISSDEEGAELAKTSPRSILRKWKPRGRLNESSGVLGARRQNLKTRSRLWVLEKATKC